MLCCDRQWRLLDESICALVELCISLTGRICKNGKILLHPDIAGLWSNAFNFWPEAMRDNEAIPEWTHCLTYFLRCTLCEFSDAMIEEIAQTVVLFPFLEHKI